MVVEKFNTGEMQSLGPSSIQGCRETGHRNFTAQGPPELIFQRQENKETGDGRKFPALIIEDETKNYVDGIGDSSDGEPDHKIPRGGLVHSDVRQKKTRGRVKIKMEFIENKLRRYTTFSKRKTGIMKKAYELSTLTGTQVMLLVASETGHVYTFATRKLQPMITSESGKALIQTCLNSPDPTPLLTQLAPQNPSDQRMSQTGYEEPDLQYSAGDEDVKPQASEGQQPSMMTGIQFTQSGQGITTYIAPPSSQVALHQPTTQPAQQHTSKSASPQQPTFSLQSVPAGAVTAILAPPGTNQTPVTTGQTVQIHQSTAMQPQIIQGQLQMHKIHPQNILLSGNMPGIQGGHIIISPNQLGSQVVIADGTNVQTVTSNSTTASNPHENIIIVPSGGSNELPVGTVQMVYNTPTGLVYVPHTGAVNPHSQASTTSSTESVTIHHQPSVPASVSSYHIQETSRSVTGSTVLQST